MKPNTVLIYGAVCYLIFLASFLYLVGFVAGVVVPKGVNDGALVAWPLALSVDLGLILLFGVQHTVMARAGFKRAWTRIVPPPAERSTYVLVSSLALILLYIAWLPLPAVIWSIDIPWLRSALWAGFLAGWALVLLSTFLIDHFALFGLRQIWDYKCAQKSRPAAFQARTLYKWVRHPLMTGFLIAFWCTPDMSLGLLVFAVGMSVYILVGTLYEERDLMAAFGERYRSYAARVPRFLPGGRGMKTTKPR